MLTVDSFTHLLFNLRQRTVFQLRVHSWQPFSAWLTVLRIIGSWTDGKVRRLIIVSINRFNIHCIILSLCHCHFFVHLYVDNSFTHLLFMVDPSSFVGAVQLLIDSPHSILKHMQLFFKLLRYHKPHILVGLPALFIQQLKSGLKGHSLFDQETYHDVWRKSYA